MEKVIVNEDAEIFISSGYAEKYLNNELTKQELIDLLNTVSANYFNYSGEIDNLPISLIKLHVDVNIVDGVELNVQEFRKWRRNGEYVNAKFILEDGKYICGVEIEKMSKSKFNTVNPDDLVARYGADTFRMYEMFLGPVEMSKPWDTKGIEGVHRFLKKLWRLFYKESGSSQVSPEGETWRGPYGQKKKQLMWN